MRIRIPSYAKLSAKKALILRSNLPKSKQFGLDKAQAKKLGINSGVDRARQIISNNYLSHKDTERVAAFYSRFKNKKGVRANGAINLWGGRKFGRLAVKHVRGENNG